MANKVERQWQPPAGAAAPNEGPRLTLYNSLLDEKVTFVPTGGQASRQISWYTCGPTVYDSAHMGHARNYVSFDIVRRVLEDYFGYECLFVMNVTDVDDKIILRARRNHLLQQYRAEATDASQARAFAQAALESATAKQGQKVTEAQSLIAADDLVLAQGDKKDVRSRREEMATTLKNEQHKLGRVEAAAVALQCVPAAGIVDDLLAACGDYVADALDKERGHLVTDSSIFRAHAAKYEREFMEDMTALGCRPATVLTRVSEYIPEVVQYVQKIMANGMAYQSNGSVYFDTQSFRGCGHTYGKLKPWAVGSALLAAEGEVNFDTREKRCPMDFALWKACKPGEPTWDSPWGKGRPGWHIECSAMASSILGQRMDIHTGGEDLRFPHHDNELAQAEAHYHHEGCHQWVNYFLHCGHLEIEGLKMSKSLKNFITIREALQSYSARQLRLMFAMQPWNKPMMYGEQTRFEMKAREAQFKNFFQNVEVAVRNVGDPTGSSSRWEAAETDLSAKLKATQDNVHTALCDSINTCAALDALGELIKATNIYLTKQEEAGKVCQPLLLGRCTAHVARILSVLGIIAPSHDSPGLGDASSQPGDDRMPPILDAFSAFRDDVRGMSKAQAKPCDILDACDRVRDTTLVDLGVRLEDRPDGKAVWKLDSPAVLRAEQAERAHIAAQAAIKKLEGQIDRKAKEAEKLAGLAALPAVEVAFADKYSQWNSTSGGFTHSQEGVALDAKAVDKMRKEVEKARKAREPLVKKLAEDPDYLQTLQREVETLRAQLRSLAVE